MHVAHIDIMFMCPRTPVVNIGEKQKCQKNTSTVKNYANFGETRNANTELKSKRSHKMTHQYSTETTKEIKEDTKTHSRVGEPVVDGQGQK